MKTTKEVEKTITFDEVDEILCNKCEKSIEIISKGNKSGYSWVNYKGGQFCPTFGYGSQYDDAIYEVHICDECWTEFMNEWKIEPVEF